MSVDVFHDNFFAMGTRLETVFWGVEESYARSVFNEIYEVVDQLEKDLSHYDEKSPITAINKNAGVKAVPVPHTVMKALQQCRHHYEATDGIFDVTVRPNAANGEARAGIVSDFTRLSYSDEEGTAYLEERGMQIDLGGIGKGMALEQVEHILDEYQIENVLISFGESSILTRGHHPHGEVWKIGITDLHDKETSRYSFDLTDHALSTSGNTPRNEGQIYHPQTGRTVSGYHTVSVLTSSPVEAEVLSTALLVANSQEQRKLIKKYNPARAVRISYDKNGRGIDATELNQSYFL